MKPHITHAPQQTMLTVSAKRLLKLETENVALHARLEQMEQERDLWKEFAEHQIPCAVCAESVYECDAAMEIMARISDVADAHNAWIDDPRLEDWKNR